jgi:hypothetical protein
MTYEYSGAYVKSTRRCYGTQSKTDKSRITIWQLGTLSSCPPIHFRGISLQPSKVIGDFFCVLIMLHSKSSFLRISVPGTQACLTWGNGHQQSLSLSNDLQTTSTEGMPAPIQMWRINIGTSEYTPSSKTLPTFY